jgi:hypothetical protein
MKSVIFFLSLSLIAESCTESGLRQYETLSKNEVASGRHVDSLFFGIYFGMTNKDFFTYCWQQNKKGIFMDGQNNMYVLYKMKNNELQHPASMNFYPDFYQNKIYKMRVLFQYDAWAPWNKQLYSDSLLPHVLELYKTWYKDGNHFIQINDKEKGTIYVKVDGNRRITIGRYDDMTVKVDYTDLLLEPQVISKNEGQ